MNRKLSAPKRAKNQVTHAIVEIAWTKEKSGFEVIAMSYGRNKNLDDEKKPREAQ